MDAVTRDYTRARFGIAVGCAVTMIRIDDGATTVATGTGASPDAIVHLRVGAGITAADHFSEDLPSPRELENAITTIENELERVRVMDTRDSPLVTCDPELCAMARFVGVSPESGQALSRRAVEQLFQELSAASLRTSVLRVHEASGATYAARLLILREVMHHLGFPELHVRC